MKSLKRKGATTSKRVVITKKIALLALVGASLFGVAFIYSQRTVVKDVSYDPCEINYGQVVGEWDGEGNDSWNERDFHYQVREFSLKAHAPGINLAKVIERQPELIATGGEQACREDFSELIDTKSDDYRWNGARTTAVRLGAPNLGDINDQGKYLSGRSTEPFGALTPPVFSDGYGQASVWLDDGARASLILGNQPKELWCQGFNGCGDITQIKDDGKAVRGAGYLFVEDNCPTQLPCGESHGWYNQLNYTNLVGKQTDYLKPFSLRLEAVSTYADTVGTRMLLTFKYPSKVALKTEVTANAGNLMPNDEFSAKLTINKTGPAVNKLTINLDSGGQPVSHEAVTITEEQLRALNLEGKLSVIAKLKVGATAQLGACYQLPINTLVHYGKKEARERAELKYCLKSPGVTYTYNVSSKGNVSSDLDDFKRLSAETLAHARGWAAADIAFTRVASGGDFTLWLAAPDQMTSFSSGCDSTYSCQVGRHVIINDARWRNATPAWNNGGGSLRDYRHMVVNHEVGHFLGFGHYNCPKPGALAPVMQQQSINLQGCKFNPWPTPAELVRL